MKINFISLGCDKNRVDSEKMLGLLSAAGFSFTDDESEADIIIVNTCCFIEEAKTESIETILEMAEYREIGNLKYLFVAGCMSERYKEEVLVEFPEVDGFIGTSDLSQIVDLVKQKIAEDNSELAEHFKDAARITSYNRIITTPGHYEFLKIAEGCNKRCTYCIIPYIRGSYHSFPIDELISEAEELAEHGCSEIILAAQETNIYGRDLYGRDMLPELIRRIAQIEEIRWIRLLYCYPEDITDELLKVMASEPKVCRYIDMPIQHASDSILKKMGRRTTRDKLVKTINKVREAVPGIAIRTTLITGFPSETQEDHNILKEFVQSMRFDRLGVFTYSREEGTPAYSFDNQIDEDIKSSRRDELMSVQELISYENLAGRIGESFDVVVDGYLPEEDVYVGRTYMDAPDVDGAFFFRSERSFLSGDHVECIVTNVSDYDLYGEIAQ